MAYTAQISRANPSCFLFLVDQSGSMSGQFGTPEINRNKADGVALTVNRLLQNLVLKCRVDVIRDYYYVGVIGYGAQVGPVFGGSLSGKELVPISEIGNKPVRLVEIIKKVEDGAGGLVDEKVRMPVWFDPIADGGTPMCEALNRASSIVKDWLNHYPNGFPPTVINISDGEATDGNPTVPAESLKKLASSDGNVLLYNVHISSSRASQIEFPDNEERLPDKHARLLFGMSSILPEYIRKSIQIEGIRVSEKTRGFVFNADIVAVIKFLDVGTRPYNLLA